MAHPVLADLQNPPIVEVVCGVFFEANAELDPLCVGRFWTLKRREYPKRELKPPVTEATGVQLRQDLGPVRCWLVSERGEFIVQVQPDRFYFNWRKRAEVYPRFGNHGGREGVLAMALREFKEFEEFTVDNTGVRPMAIRVELTKIDVVAFATIDDLRRDLPLVEAIHPWTRSSMPELNVQLVEQVDGIDRFVSLSNAFVGPDMSRAVRIETRASCDCGVEMGASFEALNMVVNEVFASLFSSVALARFQGSAS